MQILALDVTSDESVEDAAKTVAALTGGRLDLLLNNVSHPPLHLHHATTIVSEERADA